MGVTTSSGRFNVATLRRQVNDPHSRSVMTGLLEVTELTQQNRRMTISTREATEADEQWLFQLHEDAHRDLVEAAYGPWIVSQQQEFFRPLVDDHEVFVLEEDGIAVGSLYLGTQGDDTWVELIEVTPSRQGEGIGAAALRWVVERSAKSGRGTLLQVHKVNVDAKRLYEREGFADAGATETHHMLRHE